jgi:hypothetical protein
MPNIIDNTYLVDAVFIPNALTMNTLNIAYSEVQNLIQLHERDYLEKLLGVELASLFLVNPSNGAHYPRLLKGDVFIDSLGRQKKWKGFAKTNPTDQLISPIACYIYCKWLANHQLQMTSTGAVTTSFDNGVRVTNWGFYRNVWNLMVDQNKIVHDFLIANKQYFPKYEGIKFNPYECDSNAYDLFHYSNHQL